MRFKIQILEQLSTILSWIWKEDWFSAVDLGPAAHDSELDSHVQLSRYQSTLYINQLYIFIKTLVVLRIWSSYPMSLSQGFIESDGDASKDIEIWKRIITELALKAPSQQIKSCI